MNTGFQRDWMKTTTLNPAGLAVLVVLIIAILVVRRRYAAIPMLIMACFVAPGQNVVIGGLSFYLLRTLTLVGFVRCLIRGEHRMLRWSRTDSAIAAWSVASTIVFSAQYGAAGTVTKVGWFCDGALAYYLFRCLIRDLEDIRIVTLALIVIGIPVLVAFLVEHATAHNLFAAFGGVPEITDVREGRLRCQGAFAHPILAGCFWASALPLIVAQWWHPKTERWLVVVGILSTLVIIILCASATPIAAIGAGSLGGVLFLARRYMSLLRWSAVAIVISLHMVMKAPVWSLIQRIDIVGGSTGEFRYRLIDGAVKNFSEWCLLGTTDTAHWGWGLQDVCNQYILEGVRGGVVSLLLFLLIFVFSFQNVGRLCRGAKTVSERALCWALGVTLFVHCVNFIGVAYFGQITMLLFLHLAMGQDVMFVQSARLPEPSRATSAPRRARWRGGRSTHAASLHRDGMVLNSRPT